MLRSKIWLALGLYIAGPGASPVLADAYPPAAGTERDSAAYLDAAERFLGAIDLDDESLEFSRLGGTTATNWSVERDGQKLADLKCTQGNTNHKGAIIAYRLGRELGFNIYPVSVYRDVDLRIGGRSVQEQCALKEWAVVFTQYYWTRDTFSTTDNVDKQRLTRALRCDNAKPGADDAFNYVARSAYGNPKPEGARRVRYVGSTTLRQATMDFSNMMVIDTLIGNEDRFPGGNLFFRSVSTSYTDRDGAVVFDDVRLFSLDNEAAFKGRSPDATHSAKDLKQHVTRFDADMIAALRKLADDSEALGRITDGDEALTAFIRSGIRIVLDQYASAVTRCGEEMAVF